MFLGRDEGSSCHEDVEHPVATVSSMFLPHLHDKRLMLLNWCSVPRASYSIIYCRPDFKTKDQESEKIHCISLFDKTLNVLHLHEVCTSWSCWPLCGSLL